MHLPAAASRLVGRLRQCPAGHLVRVRVRVRVRARARVRERG